jgi:tetratricopeptide (TPR) repeat protein
MSSQRVHDLLRRWKGIVLSPGRTPEKQGILRETIEEALALWANGTGPSFSLVAAVASRILADISQDRDVEQSAAALLRQAAAGVDQFGPSQLLAVAKLLYDSAQYGDAIGVFQRHLVAKGSGGRPHSTDDARAVFLLAYCYEAVGRKERDIARLNLGIELLQEWKTHADRSISAEARHIEGHLLIGRYLVATQAAAADRTAALRSLRGAVEMNPAYSSCWTSGYAELGDHISTITFSLQAMQERAYRQLTSAEESETVEMEILFYIAYAYSCIGEYQRALRCFEAFVFRMRALSRPEARDHASLFIVKTELKRSMLDDLTYDKVRDWRNHVRTLSFGSRGARPVAEEARRYEGVLDFLCSFIGFRSNLPSNDWMGLYRQSDYLVRMLCTEVPELTRDKMLTVVTECTDLAACGLDGLPDIWQREAPGAVTGSGAMIGDVIAIDRCDAGELRRIVTAFGRSRYIVAHIAPDAESAESYDDCDLVQTTGDFRQTLTVAAALALCKRFLIQDRYVFALAPCQESPAVLYQTARHNLEECFA